MSFQAHLDNAEKITGRTPQQLVDEAAGLGLTQHGPIVAWLAARDAGAVTDPGERTVGQACKMAPVGFTRCLCRLASVIA